MEKKEDLLPSVAADADNADVQTHDHKVGELIQLEGVDVALAEKMRLVNDVCPPLELTLFFLFTNSVRQLTRSVGLHTTPSYSASMALGVLSI